MVVEAVRYGGYKEDGYEIALDGTVSCSILLIGGFGDLAI